VMAKTPPDVASIHRAAESLSIPGNPYADLRILMRWDRGKVLFCGLKSTADNTTCSGLG
jgi:hypothetical protein